MDFHSLATLYANKTDEEILHLYSDLEQLTPEAQSLLLSEMGKRRLNPEKPASPLGATLPGHASASQKTDLSVPPAPRFPAGEFIGEVFRLYHENLWLFLKITFPAVLLGVLSIQSARHIQRAVLRPLAFGDWYRLVEGFFVSTAGFLVSWTGFCLAFAAISVGIRRLGSGSDVSASGAFGTVRTKLSLFLRVSTLLFTVFYIGTMLTAFILFVVFGSFVNRLLRAVPFSYYVSGFLVVTAFSLITSRLGLAIPAVVLDDFTVGQAFFRSDELTEGRWAILAVLLTKSILGGYVVGMLPFWLARWVTGSINLPSWTPWALTGLSIAAVTLVEPIMFIGFALLYEKTCGRAASAEFQTVASAS